MYGPKMKHGQNILSRNLRSGARGWRKTARLGAAEDRGSRKRKRLLPLLYSARYSFCHSACFARLFKTAKRRMPARGKAEYDAYKNP